MTGVTKGDTRKLDYSSYGCVCVYIHTYTDMYIQPDVVSPMVVNPEHKFLNSNCLRV